METGEQPHFRQVRGRRYPLRNMSAEAMPVGSVGESDKLNFCSWMWRQRESSNFDPRSLEAPRACMIKVTQSEKPIAYMPIQPAIVLESLCNDESLTKTQLTLAIYEIHKMVKKLMSDSGMAEAFFTTSNDRFVYLCEGQGWKKHLFDEARHTWLMRLQCGSL